MATRDIRDNRPRLEAFRRNLCLQIIGPPLATCASEHFNAR
jgi:hypothetical protein